MATYAEYALVKLHILPSVFLQMERQEKAFLIAVMQRLSKAEKDAADKIKS